jgi:F0F1-type ATP synthase delta subunit
MWPKIASELPAHTQPKARRALAEDDKELTNMLCNILKSDDRKELVLALCRDHAKEFVALLRLQSVGVSIHDVTYS